MMKFNILLMSPNILQGSTKNTTFFFFLRGGGGGDLLGTLLYKISQNWINFPFETFNIKNISEFTWKKYPKTHKVSQQNVYNFL